MQERSLNGKAAWESPGLDPNISEPMLRLKACTPGLNKKLLRLIIVVLLFVVLGKEPKALFLGLVSTSTTEVYPISKLSTFVQTKKL